MRIDWRLLTGSLALLFWLVTCERAVAGTDEDAHADSAADEVYRRMAEPWTGDLDGIVQRGFLRVGVSHGVLYFVADGPETSGLTVDLMAEFEKHLRAELGEAARDLTVVLLPLPRDRLLPALEGGQVDLIAANLTITPERSARVDFTEPFTDTISEIVILAPDAPAVATLDALHEVTLHVRASSSYHEHLITLDAQRREAGQPGLRLVAADENLEDEDLLELLELGVKQAVVIDSHKARLLSQIFTSVQVREDLVINQAGAIAWALRRNSPQLLAAANHFVANSRRGTLLGNILARRYYADSERIRHALSDDEHSRLAETIDLFHRYAGVYEFDALMIAAQGYQESRLDQNALSPAGAIGIMQLLPTTASDPMVAIPDIHIAERNVEAGVKYLRLLRDRFLDDPAISSYDQTLMAFAAYNAGPGNLRRARTRTEAMGLDPNVWFGNVELGMAKAVSREPVVYVRNILKYFVTYRLAEQLPQPASTEPSSD